MNNEQRAASGGALSPGSYIVAGGKYAPKEYASNGGALSAEQVRKECAMLTPNPDGWNWQGFADGLNAHLAAHDQKVRKQVLEEAASVKYKEYSYSPHSSDGNNQEQNSGLLERELPVEAQRAIRALASRAEEK